MRKIIDFFIARSFLVNLISAFICIIGLVAMIGMKRDLIPPMEFQVVSVTARVPGASTLEMERLVTFPIEEALKGLPGLAKISSETDHGGSSITLLYEPGYDEMQSAVEAVRARIFGLSNRLPQNLLPVQVFQQKVNEVFLSIYALENFKQDDPIHRAAVGSLQKKIEGISGVVRTEADYQSRDVYVRFNPDRLRAHGVSASEVRRRLHEELAYTPIGRVRHNEVDMSVAIKQTEVSLETLAETPITGNRVGNVLRLKDVAKVEFGAGSLNSLSLYNGKAAGYIVVHKDTTSDSIRLHQSVQKVIDDFNSANATPVKASIVFEGPKFIQKQISVLSVNGLGGLVLVFLILMVFLNFRTAVMTSIGVPIAYLGTLWVLSSMGIAIDLISIVGMILVVGILVDDAIIVSERYIENLTKGMEPKEAASRAARDLIVPVTGTILTTIVAFLPIMLIKSDIMTVLYAIPIVILTSLSISWFESFFILPNHLAHFVKTPPKDKSERFFEKFRNIYRRSLRHTLKWRYPYALALVTFTVFSFWVAGTQLRHEFNLNIGNDRLDIYAVMKEGNSLEETAKQLEPIHAYLKSLNQPGLGSIDTKVGRFWRDGRQYNGFRYAKVAIWLDPAYPHLTELKSEMLKKLEPELAKMKSDAFEDLTVKEAKRGDDERKKDIVTVRIRGSDQADFDKAERAIIEAAANKGLVGEWVKPDDNLQLGWEFSPNPSQLVRYGMSQSDLGSQLKQIFTPHELAYVRIGGDSVSLYTQLDLPAIPDFGRLDRYEIRTPLGNSVPLGFLGEWTKKSSLKSVSHRNGQRVVKVDFRFDPKNANATTAKADLETKIAPLLAQFPSYEIKVDSGEESETEAQNWALKVGIYSILGVLFVLAVVLGSITQPLLVAAPIPFGIVGIIWALWLHDLPLGLMALIGLVGTVGVSVNDSLVMTDHMNNLRAERGQLDRETIVAGASDRLRAIFLTTLTTVVGVLPMAYGIGGESGFTQPLAFAMGWGLTFSTLMTLFFLPSLLEIREDVMSLGLRLWNRLRKPAPAVVTETVSVVRPVRAHAAGESESIDEMTSVLDGELGSYEIEGGSIPTWQKPDGSVSREDEPRKN